jgi:L-fuculose-phosphate aldolase
MADRASLELAKFEAAVGTRILSELGLATGIRASLGHTSMRVPGDPGKFYVKGRGYRMDVLERMRPEDMVLCDMDGNWLDGPPNSLQCSEVKIHSCILRARPEVVSVTHVHPDYAVLLSVLGKTIAPMAQDGAGLVLDPLPLMNQTKIITSDEEGDEVARTLGSSTAMPLLGHGAVTVSERSVEGSVMAMAHLEHQARLNYLAMSVAGSSTRRSRALWPKPWAKRGQPRSRISRPVSPTSREGAPARASGRSTRKSSAPRCSRTRQQ